MFLGKKGTALDTASRKLISTNPQARKKYIKLLQSMFKAHNIFTRVDNLRMNMLSADNPLSFLEEYENLDKQITEMMLSSERRCRQASSGYAWSLKLVSVA
eukprot:15358183-Ditylum_brightwellii.AAC.1